MPLSLTGLICIYVSRRRNLSQQKWHDSAMLAALRCFHRSSKILAIILLILGFSDKMSSMRSTANMRLNAALLRTSLKRGIPQTRPTTLKLSLPVKCSFQHKSCYLSSNTQLLLRRVSSINTSNKRSKTSWKSSLSSTSARRPSCNSNRPWTRV